MNYIKLSDGRVGYVEDLNHPQFTEDLKRLDLTYEIISRDEYELKTIINVLSPEQVYYNVLGGEKLKEDFR